MDDFIEEAPRHQSRRGNNYENWLFYSILMSVALIGVAMIDQLIQMVH